MKTTHALVSLALVFAALPAFAQKPAPKAAPKVAPKVAPKAKAAPTVPAENKVSGIIKSPGVKDGKFQMGAMGKKNKGTWTIDTAGAKVADKEGKAVAVADLSPGSIVGVTGAIDAKAKTIKADKVTVSFLKKAKKATPPTPKAVKPPKAPKTKAPVTPPPAKKTGGN